MEKNDQILFTKGSYYHKFTRTDIISGVYDVETGKFKRLNNYHSLDKFPNNPLIAVTRYGKLGFLNSDYDEIIPPVYELSDYDGTRAGLFRVAKNGKFGFIDKTAKEIIAPQFEYAEPFHQDSVALVLKNGKFQCINPKGRKISRCQLKPDWEIVSEMIQPGFQFIRIGKTDYQALYNPIQNKFVLPFQRGAVYPKDINHLEQPNYWVYTCEETDLKGLINLKENKKSDCLYQYIREVSEGFSIVRNGDKEGVLDADFKLKIDMKYNELRFSQVNPNHLFFRNDNYKYGIIDLNENLIAAPEYTYLHAFPNFTKTQKEYLFGILDKNGKELIPCIYDEISDFGAHELLIVKKEKKYGVVDYQNNLIVPIEYDIIYPSNHASSREGFIKVYKQIIEYGMSTGETKEIIIDKD